MVELMTKNNLEIHLDVGVGIRTADPWSKDLNIRYFRYSADYNLFLECLGLDLNFVHMNCFHDSLVNYMLFAVVQFISNKLISCQISASRIQRSSIKMPTVLENQH